MSLSQRRNEILRCLMEAGESCEVAVRPWTAEGCQTSVPNRHYWIAMDYWSEGVEESHGCAFAMSGIGTILPGLRPCDGKPLARESNVLSEPA